MTEIELLKRDLAEVLPFLAAGQSVLGVDAWIEQIQRIGDPALRPHAARLHDAQGDPALLLRAVQMLITRLERPSNP